MVKLFNNRRVWIDLILFPRDVDAGSVVWCAPSKYLERSFFRDDVLLFEGLWLLLLVVSGGWICPPRLTESTSK